MITTRDPETMTIEERQQEVASILARGLLRRVRPARAAVPNAGEKPAEGSPDRLDLPAKTRLSVAP
ncbi:MAG: hypothetical protein ACLFVH_14885 [Phycisphaerae bacterium]